MNGNGSSSASGSRKRNKDKASKNGSELSDKILKELRDSLDLKMREKGDGESEPHTPPAEKASTSHIPENNRIKETDHTDDLDTTGSFKMDLITSMILVIAAATRFFNLTYPQNIVFDELHYGKYASLYLRKIFFFDPHPPLGKQLLSASAAFFQPNYNGSFRFDRIGSPYPDWVPVFGLRFVPAFCGTCLPAACYILCREFGISKRFSIFAALFVIFDNALLIQSRYILMEVPLILFGVLSIIFSVKSSKCESSVERMLYIILSALFGTFSLSIKYVGSFYLIISAIVIFYNLWTKLVPRKDISDFYIMKRFGTTFVTFWSIFFITYISIFYIHLSVLTNAGPHDSIMTSAFQASLKGGLASIIKGQPLQIAHGSQVTLRHSLGRPCWLHSHQHNYPIKYTDNRGSSHQQQVTCYSFKDVNNWWIIKRPSIENLVVNGTKDIIRHNDEIHLVHGMSGRLLNSHDVAAPMSPQNQEVSCYIDHNVSMAAEPLWRVEIIGGCGDDSSGGSNADTSGANCEWHAVKSTIRLVHVTSGQALKLSGKQLPKWGFNQHEVATDRIVVQDETVWNVEEHRYTKSEKEREKELLEAEMIPTKPTTLTFWEKFRELQWKMLTSGGGGSPSESHTYASFPTDWFLLTRGIAYWIQQGSNAQIHLLGNPVLWITASLGVIFHLLLLTFYLLRQRRKFYDINQEKWEEQLFQSIVLLGGYLLTYLYHFCIDKTFFLHHYLPSYVFKLLLLASTFNHINFISSKNKLTSWIFYSLFSIWTVYVVYAFTKFTPLTFGNESLSKSQLEELKWFSSWDFIVQIN